MIVSGLARGQNDLHIAFKNEDFKTIRSLFNDSVSLIYKTDATDHTPLFYLFENLHKNKYGKSLKIFKWVKQTTENSQNCPLQLRFYQSLYFSTVVLNDTFAEQSPDDLFNMLIEKASECTDSLHIADIYIGNIEAWLNKVDCNKGDSDFREKTENCYRALKFIPESISADSVEFFKSKVYYFLGRVAFCKSLTDTSALKLARCYMDSTFFHYNSHLKFSNQIRDDFISYEINYNYLLKDIAIRTGDIDTQNQALDKIISLFQGYISLLKDSAMIISNIIDFEAAILDKYFLSGQTNISLLNEALEINGQIKNYTQRKTDYYFQKAAILFKYSNYYAIQGDFNKARIYIDKALNANDQIKSVTKELTFNYYMQRGDIFFTKAKISNSLNQSVDSIFAYNDSLVAITYVLENLMSENELLPILKTRKQYLIIKKAMLNPGNHIPLIDSLIITIEKIVEISKKYLPEESEILYETVDKSLYKNIPYNDSVPDTSKVSNLKEALNINSMIQSKNTEFQSRVLDQRYLLFHYLSIFNKKLGKYEEAIRDIENSLLIVDKLFNEYNFVWDRFNSRGHINDFFELANLYGNADDCDVALNVNRELEDFVSQIPTAILTTNDYKKYKAGIYQQRADIYLKFHKTMYHSLDTLNLALNNYKTAYEDFFLIYPETKYEKYDTEYSLAKMEYLIAKSYCYFYFNHSAYKLDKNEYHTLIKNSTNSSLDYLNRAEYKLESLFKEFPEYFCDITNFEKDLNLQKINTYTIRAIIDGNWQAAYSLCSELLNKNLRKIREYTNTKNDSERNCLYQARFDLLTSSALARMDEYHQSKDLQDIHFNKLNQLFDEASAYLDSCMYIAEKLNNDYNRIRYYFTRTALLMMRTGHVDNNYYNDTTYHSEALKLCELLIAKIKQTSNIGLIPDNDQLFSYFMQYGYLLIQQNDTVTLHEVIEDAQNYLHPLSFVFLSFRLNYEQFIYYFNLAAIDYISAIAKDKYTQLAEKYLLKTNSNIKEFRDQYPERYNAYLFVVIEFFNHFARFYDGIEKHDLMWAFIKKSDELLKDFNQGLYKSGYLTQNNNENKRNYFTHGTYNLELYALKANYYTGTYQLDQLESLYHEMEQYISDSIFQANTLLTRSDSVSIYLAISDMYHKLSSLAYDSEDFARSVELQQKSIDYALNSGSKNSIRDSYWKMGLLYSYQNNFEKVISYNQLAKKIAVEINSNFGIFLANWTIASAYKSLEQYHSSLTYYIEAGKYAKGRYRLDVSREQLTIYQKLGRYEELKPLLDTMNNIISEIEYKKPAERAEDMKDIAMILYPGNDSLIPEKDQVFLWEVYSDYLASAINLYDSLGHASESTELAIYQMMFNFAKLKYQNNNQQIYDPIGYFMSQNYDLIDLINQPFINLSGETILLVDQLLKTFNLIYFEHLKDTSNQKLNDLIYSNALLQKYNYAEKANQLINKVYETNNDSLIAVYRKFKESEHSYSDFLKVSADRYSQNYIEFLEVNNTSDKQPNEKVIHYTNFKNKLSDSLVYYEKQLWGMLKEDRSFMMQNIHSSGQIRETLNEKEVAVEFIRAGFDETDLNHFMQNKQIYDSPNSNFYYALLIKHDLEYPVLVPLFSGDDFERFEREIGGNVYDSISKLQTELAGIHDKMQANHNLKKLDFFIAMHLDSIINDRYTDSKEWLLYDTLGNITDKKKVSLYSLIWEPLQPYIDSGDVVYYSPYGCLNNISFNSIKKQDGTERFLIEDYEFIKLNSTRTIVELKKEQGENPVISKALAFSDINYGTEKQVARTTVGKSKSSYAGFENKCGFPDYEIKNWDSYLTDSLFSALNYKFEKVSGERADKITFINALQRNEFLDILLIATHGYYNNCSENDTANSGYFMDGRLSRFIDPLSRVGLVFANANDPDKRSEDYIVNGTEISKLLLPGNELVILAACESGLGDNISSEGVFGFQRAFKIAGSKYILSSLWKVHIPTSNKFLGIFLNDYLQNPADINKSYRNTVLNLLKDPYYKKNPFYWSSYDLIR